MKMLVEEKKKRRLFCLRHNLQTHQEAITPPNNHKNEAGSYAESPAAFIAPQFGEYNGAYSSLRAASDVPKTHYSGIQFKRRYGERHCQKSTSKPAKLRNRRSTSASSWKRSKKTREADVMMTVAMVVVVVVVVVVMEVVAVVVATSPGGSGRWLKNEVICQILDTLTVLPDLFRELFIELNVVHRCVLDLLANTMNNISTICGTVLDRKDR
ncbi:hypothetical protein WN51_00978 [Melipona quadrifasciata]|uniref:Uncharacterized protein n=1 Tax=Melipona quadrifasciata TaxID=166423 RepID=A0A0M8ZW26_9HYME|nr:hypothetical protein WN51_00978 [Melipona quadrifasciata]